jgi:acylphosphatase
MTPEANEPRQRREVYFSGRVQGVGFRYTARDIAARYDVSGFVKNLADGRVLLVVEGLPATVDQFIRAIHDEMHRFIHSVHNTASPATNEFTGFAIRH